MNLVVGHLAVVRHVAKEVAESSHLTHKLQAEVEWVCHGLLKMQSPP